MSLIATAALMLAQAMPGDYADGPFAHIKADLQGDRPPGPPAAQLETLTALITSEKAGRTDTNLYVVTGAIQFWETKSQVTEVVSKTAIAPGFWAKLKACQPHYPRLLGPDYVRLIWDCGAGKQGYVSWIGFAGNKVALIQTSNLVLPTVLVVPRGR